MSKRGKRGAYKLKPEVEETILRHLRAGAFQNHACEAAGIEYRTMKYWLERADAGEKPYVAFAIKVRKALAEDALRLQSIVTRAALGHIEGDWKAAAWSLERKHPCYGRAAMQAAAAVTLRGGGAAAGDDDGNSTTVQFWLPDNTRRPDEADEDEA